MAAKKKTTKKTASQNKAQGDKAKLTTKAKAKKTAGKLSALDAAAKVLAEAKEPLNARQMIEQMAAKGYWKSPSGQTPWATLYAAIIRELKNKGKEARFKKTDRGLFALNQ